MNNNTAPLYTPLESLLLFQSLLSHGLEPAAFAQISSSLKDNTFIRNEPTYDAGRLSPESLQELFLHLLREELRGEADHADPKVDGAAVLSPNSKKRKLQAPPLPTLQEARAHVQKLPILVERLYARYRDHMVKSIRDDEESITALIREIDQIERGEWDDRIRKEVATSKGPNGVPKLEPTKGSKAPNGSDISPAPSPLMPVPPLKTAPVPVAVSSHAAQPVLGVKPSEPPKPQNSPPAVLQPPQGVHFAPRPPTLAPQPTQPPQIPQTDALSRPDPGKPKATPQAQQAQAPGSLKWEPPYQPHPHPGSIPQQRLPSAQHYQQTLPPGQPPHQRVPQPLAPYLPPHQPLQHAQSPGVPAQQPHSSLVPPPNAGQLGPPPPTQGPPVNAPTMISGISQSQRPMNGPPLPGQSRIDPPAIYPQVVSGYPPNVRPVVSPSPTPPSSVATSSPIAPPPPQIQKQQGTQQQQQQQQQQQRQQLQRLQQQRAWPPSTVHPAAATQKAAPSPSLSPAPPAEGTKGSGSPYIQPRPAIPDHLLSQRVATPTPSSRVQRQPVFPQTPIPIATPSQATGSGTKWKSARATPSTPGPEIGEVPSPAYEPLSPVLKHAVPPRSTRSKSPKRQSRKPVQQIDTSVAKQEGRSLRNAAKNRDVSGSSAAAGSQRGRSPSMASQTEEIKEPVSARIKNEEETPRPLEETGDTTADESVPGRRQPFTPGSISSRVGKRKQRHDETPPPLPSLENRAPPPAPTHVLWTRGFPRISSSALDQIGSHRHANMFAHQIRDRDAPGYKTIVYQPQDLKSIRAAISQGNKAAGQALAKLPGGDPGTSSVWLPIGVDLVPPRGIINTTQLERELIHMFANAIMYNPDPYRGVGTTFLRHRGGEGGEDGEVGDDSVLGYQVIENAVVNETRDMFVEVEKLLSDLRSAERAPPAPAGALGISTRHTSVVGGREDAAATEEEVEGTPATEAEAAGAASTLKRRRITRGQ